MPDFSTFTEKLGMDFNFELKNGKLLKGMVISPGDNPSGVIVLVHGIGEHIGRYSHWAERFKSENFASTGLDFPGHGRSDGKRGRIKNIKVLHEAIDNVLKTAGRTYPGLPLFIYGHSLGGGLVLEYLLKNKPQVKGAIITSPGLKLAFDPPKSKLALVSVLGLLAPGMVLSSGLDTSHLSHDQSVVDAYNKDPLVHDRISLGFYSGIMSSARYSLSQAAELKTPTLILHGSADMICSPDGSREFCAKASNAELRIWEGGFHELHNEPFRDEVFRFIIDWIRKRITGTRVKEN
jgi:acylglycerol lipase